MEREPGAYTVEETVTWRDWEAYLNAGILRGKVTGPVARGTRTVLRGIGLFLAVLGGALAGLSLLSGRPGFLTALGAVMLYYGVREFRQTDAVTGLKGRGAQWAMQRSVPDTPTHFTFEDGGFNVWEPSGSASCRYHALEAVWEDGERFYLLLPGKQCRVLQKSAFTRGGPADFRSFLEGKTGKPVVTIRSERNIFSD